MVTLRDGDKNLLVVIKIKGSLLLPIIVEGGRMRFASGVGR